MNVKSPQAGTPNFELTNAIAADTWYWVYDYMMLHDIIWLYMVIHVHVYDYCCWYIYNVPLWGFISTGREGGGARLWLQHMYHHLYWPAGVSTKPTVGVWMVFITQHTHSTLCLLCKTGFLCMQNISWSERSARKTAGICGVANTNRFEVWLFRLSRISYHISHIYRKEAIRILIWDSWGYSEQLDL